MNRLLLPLVPPDFNLPLALATPGPGHWLGCDAFGRELAQLTLYAAFNSLSFVVLAISLSVFLALLVAGITLSLSQSVQDTTLRLLDFFLAFPSLLLALSLASLWGPGETTLLASLTIGVLPSLSRLLLIRGREHRLLSHYEAAHALGASRWHLARFYDLPELFQLVRLKLPGFFSHAILAEASLSFLGVGAPVGQETWGSLLAQGKDYLIEAPQIAFVSGLPLFASVLILQIWSDRRSPSART